MLKNKIEISFYKNAIDRDAQSNVYYNNSQIRNKTTHNKYIRIIYNFISIIM